MASSIDRRACMRRRSNQREMPMTDGVSQKPKGLARGRPFAKGPSNRPTGRRAGSRNKKTLAAAVLLEGEAEPGAGRARERPRAAAPPGWRRGTDPARPPGRKGADKSPLPPIESAADIAPAMKAVTSALAAGIITPGEAGTIAA